MKNIHRIGMCLITLTMLAGCKAKESTANRISADSTQSTESVVSETTASDKGPVSLSPKDPEVAEFLDKLNKFINYQDDISAEIEYYCKDDDNEYTIPWKGALNAGKGIYYSENYNGSSDLLIKDGEDYLHQAKDPEGTYTTYRTDAAGINAKIRTNSFTHDSLYLNLGKAQSREDILDYSDAQARMKSLSESLNDVTPETHFEKVSITEANADTAFLIVTEAKNADDKDFRWRQTYYFSGDRLTKAVQEYDIQNLSTMKEGEYKAETIIETMTIAYEIPTEYLTIDATAKASAVSEEVSVTVLAFGDLNCANASSRIGERLSTEDFFTEEDTDKVEYTYYRDESCTVPFGDDFVVASDSVAYATLTPKTGAAIAEIRGKLKINDWKPGYANAFTDTDTDGYLHYHFYTVYSVGTDLPMNHFTSDTSKDFRCKVGDKILTASDTLTISESKTYVLEITQTKELSDFLSDMMGE